MSSRQIFLEYVKAIQSFKSSTQKQKSKIKGQDRRKVVLSALYTFCLKGVEEISLPEFLESIYYLQEKYDLGYEFWDRFLYSPRLMKDLASLHFEGYIKRYEYRHDAFLPKQFLSLTLLGKGTGKRHREGLSEQLKETLEIAVDNAIQNYKKRWQFYRRD